MEIMQLIILGLAVGFMSSFFGIGGGSLIVPVLYSLYPKLPASVVVPISLGAIFVVTSVNSFKFARQRLLPPKKVIVNFIITCSIGAFTGSQILYLINTSMAKKIMGMILIIMVVKLIVFKAKDNSKKEFKISSSSFGLTGFSGAFLSSITGLGGGIIFTPIFLNVLKVPLKLVSPYANLAMLIGTFIGVVPHLFQSHNNLFFNNQFMNLGFIGNVNFTFIFIIAFGAFFSSDLGVKYNSLAKPQLKKALLIVLLLIFSGKLLFY